MFPLRKRGIYRESNRKHLAALQDREGLALLQASHRKK
jgi:hypothetical protein